MNKGGEVTSIIKDHVEGLATCKASKSLLNAPLILFLSLALPGKDGDAGGGDTKHELVSSSEANV